MTTARQRLGQRGEDAACEFLVRQGMKVIDRNWRCGYGEADIIVLDGRTLVFCEVKTRTSKKYGKPEESITFKKRERYYNLISVYRSRTTTRHSSIRCDAIFITVDKERKNAKLHYVRDVYGS